MSLTLHLSRADCVHQNWWYQKPIFKGWWKKDWWLLRKVHNKDWKDIWFTVCANDEENGRMTTLNHDWLILRLSVHISAVFNYNKNRWESYLFKITVTFELLH